MKRKRTLKGVLMSFLAIFFPWIVLFIEDNPGGAFVALVMQATIIGWLPASIWAWSIVHEPKKAETRTKKIDDTQA